MADNPSPPPHRLSRDNATQGPRAKEIEPVNRKIFSFAKALLEGADHIDENEKKPDRSLRRDRLPEGIRALGFSCPPRDGFSQHPPAIQGATLIP